MKVRELRQLSDGEREQKLSTLRRELYDLRSKARIGKLDKPHELSRVRREIARILTVQNETKAVKSGDIKP